MEVSVDKVETTVEVEEVNEELQDPSIDSNTSEAEVPPVTVDVVSLSDKMVVDSSPDGENREKTPERVVLNKSPQKASTPKCNTDSPSVLQGSPIKALVEKSLAEPSTIDKSPAKTVTAPTDKTPIKSISKQHSPVKEDSPKSDNSKELAKVDKTDSSPPKEPEAAVEKAPASNTSSVEITIELSTDSQPGYETPSSEVSEKDHNKSISRELRSLINSAKESKIISECTQLTSKTRKSRTLDTSLSDGKKVVARRGSDYSQESNSSERSDKTALKRTMRSQNPDFVTKQKQLQNPVSASGKKGDERSDDEVEEVKTKEVEPSTPKKKTANDKITEPTKTSKIRIDSYCWRCHWAAESASNEKAPKPISCTVCPRTYHFKCLNGPERNSVHTDKSWVCPECVHIMQAESSETRSPAMRKINLGMLCDLLKYALKRMMEVNGVEPFLSPVDRATFPEYDKFVVHPMALSLMKANIDAGYYGSTEAFTADVQWILHNSIIFNTLQAKLTAAARALYRSCKSEMGEIEACPECYAAAHARRPTWFTDVCSAPHILLWAKLKGFPYWPAKGMSVNSAGMVDVRFFGAHDRAWVPARDCYLYSEKDPNNFKAKRQDIIDSMQEAEEHIRNISRKFGKFIYPAYKVTLEPTKLTEQLKNMIPQYEPESPKPAKSKPGPASVKNKRKSLCKIDGEESPRPKRKTAEKDEDEWSEKSEDKTKKLEEPSSTNKEVENSRKRRRSVLEEAVLTVIDSTEKRTRLEPGTSDSSKASSTEDKEEKRNKEDTTSTPKAKSDKDTEKTPKIKPKGSSTPKIVLKLNLSKTPKSVDRLKAKRREKSSSIEKDKSVAKTKAKRNKSLSDAESSKSDTKTKDSGKASPLLKGKASPRPKEDDNTALAVMKKKAGALNMPLLISNVRTLTKPNSPKTKTDGKDTTKIFTPTSTDNVNNIKDAVEKLQTLRNNNEQSLVGKVGVRAFARMTSPNSKTKDCTVEVKAEPIDVEEAERERESQKIDLLNSFSLRPVNPTSLRDIRINKITPVVNPVRKPCPKPIEIRPRAKKTFPQPKKPEEGPSGLNSKNSMVYIPIPPTTQAPRPPCKANGPVNSSPPVLRQQSPVVNSVQNTLVNTVTPPLMSVSTAGPRPTAQVPASVHTVPFITSVNGQWTFSLQPVMAVGGQENSNSPPKLNGIDRPITLPTSLPNPPQLVSNENPPALAPVTPALTMAAMAASGLQPVQPPIMLPNMNDKTTPDELPRLQKNQSLVIPHNDLSTACDLPVPSTAGPVTQRMNLNAVKLADYFRNLITESLEKAEDPWAQLTLAKKQIETLTWKHQQQLKELRHNHDLLVTEMRTSFEKERARLAADAAKTQADLEAAVKHAKSRHWCANCGAEAQLHCCWGAAYCGRACQRAHRPRHAAACAACARAEDGSERTMPSEERLQPPDLPNITPSVTVTKTVGGKTWPSMPPRIAPAPVAPAPAPAPNQNKSSIIVSMVEDTGGNQTVKCVGTYKAPSASPLLINKQLMNNEENAPKKVVTSGGYLIVGAGAPSPGPVVIN